MRRAEQGFTILEALVAFAILAAVATALGSAAISSLALIEKGERIQRATLLARSKLDEFAATRGPLAASDDGVFAGSDIAWHLQATDIPDGRGEAPSLRLQRVRLTLTWSGKPLFAVETRHLGGTRR